MTTAKAPVATAARIFGAMAGTTMMDFMEEDNENKNESY